MHFHWKTPNFVSLFLFYYTGWNATGLFWWSRTWITFNDWPLNQFPPIPLIQTNNLLHAYWYWLLNPELNEIWSHLEFKPLMLNTKFLENQLILNEKFEIHRISIRNEIECFGFLEWKRKFTIATANVFSFFFVTHFSVLKSNFTTYLIEPHEIPRIKWNLANRVLK